MDEDEAPWNPKSSLVISPRDYELQVCAWLKAAEQTRSLTVKHSETLSGPGGNYQIDVLVELQLFGGSLFRILVECKRQSRAVERDEVLVLSAKLPEVKGHKGMLFSTSGFQQGALLYAAEHGIATLSFIDGRATYFTKSLGPPPKPPSWLNLPRYAATRLSPIEGGVSCDTVDERHLEAINEWLQL